MNTKEKMGFLMLAGVSADQEKLKQEMLERMEGLERMSMQQALMAQQQAEYQRAESEQYRLAPQMLFTMHQNRQMVADECDLILPRLGHVEESDLEEIGQSLQKMQPFFTTLMTLPIAPFLVDFSQKEIHANLQSEFGQRARMINERLWRFVECLAEAKYRIHFRSLSEFDDNLAKAYIADATAQRECTNEANELAQNAKSMANLFVGAVGVSAILHIVVVNVVGSPNWSPPIWGTCFLIPVAGAMLIWKVLRWVVARGRMTAIDRKVEANWSHLRTYLDNGTDFMAIFNHVFWNGDKWQVCDDKVREFMDRLFSEYKLPTG